MRILVVQAHFPRMRKLIHQLAMQSAMLFRVGEIEHLQKGFLDLKVNLRIVAHHLDNRCKRVFDVIIPDTEVQRIDHGDDPAVLLVENRNAQIVLVIPFYKNIVV